MSKKYSRRVFLQIMAATLVTAAYAVPRRPGVGIGGNLGPPGFLRTGGANDIGIPGSAGFGVGVAPVTPTGFSLLSAKPSNDNYGNYRYTDGSVMCWIPAFYYRIGHASNPTYAAYGVNSVGVQPESAFADVAAANVAGYALPRAFIDGGAVKRGFMVDKYVASKAASGAGFVASSLKNGLPLSTHADHNPIADLTACADNISFYALDAAHARDGANGAVNPSSIFFCSSRFISFALGLLSLAHGQAASSTANCSWYDATGVTNFPKGCNNNALADVNDTAVKWESDGYSNCGKTGSAGYGGGAGNEFSKSTSNGQNCGVADINGLMWEISTGITCIATSPAIEAITSAAVPVFTKTGHGLTAGTVIQVNAITQADWTNFKDKLWTVATTPDADTFTLTSAPDTTAYAAYDAGTDPGTFTFGTFYAAKQATAMKDFTSGVSSATDHWGATGVAAMMDAFAPAFETGYPGNDFAQRFGDGAGQVLADDVSGNDWLLTGLGLPSSAAGISPSGTNLFGKDFNFQYLRDLVCLQTGATWNSLLYAGPWAARWSGHRTSSGVDVGFRVACYPV